MNILLGGFGKVGLELASMLKKEGHFLTVVDVSSERRKTADKLGVDFINKDIFKLQEEIKDYDLFVNLLPSRFSKRAVEFALDKGMNYIDFSTYGETKAEQIEFADRFRDQGLKGIILCGGAPGLSNIMIKDVFEKGNKEITLYLIEHQFGKVSFLSWSPMDIISSALTQPIIYSRGKFVRTDFFQPKERINFFGEYFQMYSFFNDEMATIPNFLDINRFEILAGGSEIEFSKGIYELTKEKNLSIREAEDRLVSSLKKKDKGQGKGVFGIRVKGEKDIKEWFYYSDKGRHVSYPTALFAYQIIEHMDKIKIGLYPPELLEREIRERILLRFERIKEEGII